MNPTLKRFSFKAMGSFCEIQLYDESRIQAKHLVRQLAAEVLRLEKKYSRFREDSFLTQINHSAGAQTGLSIDEETKSLLEHALSCFQQSNGLFDISAGVLNNIWDFKKAIVPTASQIDEARSHIGFDRLRWNNSKLHMPAGMQLDFGGIVKEYAADSAASLARYLGVRHGLINLGGDFSVIGPQPENRPWLVGISNPSPAMGVIAKIDLLAGGLASSGDYQRCFQHQGKHYSHLLNPKTGWPCQGLRAVSVAANLCTVAGSLATIAMLQDEAAAKTYLAESGLPYVTMDRQQNIDAANVNN